MVNIQVILNARRGQSVQYISETGKSEVDRAHCILVFRGRCRAVTGEIAELNNRLLYCSFRLILGLGMSQNGPDK